MRRKHRQNSIGDDPRSGSMHQVTPGEETTCPGCGQTLRIPDTVGGMTMACPECGKTFYTVFRFGGQGSRSSQAADAATTDLPPSGSEKGAAPPEQAAAEPARTRPQRRRHPEPAPGLPAGYRPLSFVV